MTELTDDYIMATVRAGNLSALTELFDRYHVQLFNFFLKLTGDKAASQDLTQNLFYRVIKYRHTYNEGEGRFKSWAYQMARNMYYDHCREEKKITNRFKKLDHEDGMNDAPAGYGEEDFIRLEKALKQLSPEQQTMIVLSRFQGLKYKEIALMTETSVPAIKVRIHRALKELKEMYFKQA